MLQSQFQFRSHAYSRQHPFAEDRILVTDSGERIGRVLIDWSGGVGRLIDFAILGSHQGLGIGTTILNAVSRRLPSAAAASNSPSTAAAPPNTSTPAWASP